MREYTNIALPNELARKIDKVIKKSNLGFKSKSEFVKDAVRGKLLELARYENLKK